ETVEEAVPTGALQIGLSAPAGEVSRIPRVRTLAATHTVMMSDHGAPLPARHPVLTGRVHPASCGTVRIRTRQDVVSVGRITSSIHHLPAFVQRYLLAGMARFGVQLFEVACHQHAISVVPRPLADPVARVNGGFSVRLGSAQIGAPGTSCRRTDRGGQLIAMFVGACQTSEVGTIAGAFAGDEEAHLGLCVPAGGGAGDEREKCGEAEESLHGSPGRWGMKCGRPWLHEVRDGSVDRCRKIFPYARLRQALRSLVEPIDAPTRNELSPSLSVSPCGSPKLGGPFRGCPPRDVVQPEPDTAGLIRMSNA